MTRNQREKYAEDLVKCMEGSSAFFRTFLEPEALLSDSMCAFYRFAFYCHVEFPNKVVAARALRRGAVCIHP